MKQVALLMSGGVDSSVAACLLLEQGYQVIGIHLTLFTLDSTQQKKESWNKVREVSKKLGISCHLLDLQTAFQEKVMDSFFDSYRLGSTPNPCIVCNKVIKFGAFFEYAISELKVDYVSSGHYARVVQNQETFGLAKAVDKKKDQSYFLYQLNQPILRHLLLPLGDLTKPEVRELAIKFSLTTDFGKESEDVCFIPGDFRSYVPNLISDQPGNIIDTSGRVVGQHKGIHYYTIGQRQGLGIASQEPLYVIKLDPETHAVYVGTRQEAYQREVSLSELHWINGTIPAKETILTAKVRYRGEEKRCHLMELAGITKVLFEEPQFAVTKGQSLVFYEHDQVLGGGIINGT